MRAVWVAALALGLPSVSRAQAFENARLLGFGGARRALGASTDAMYVNPAGLSFARAYDIEFSYGDDFRESERQLNLTIADGQAGSIAGGIALTYGDFRPPDAVVSSQRLEGLRFDVALAALVAEGLSLGVGTRYADYRLYDGDDEIGGGGASDIAFDAGVQYRLRSGLGLGAAIRNINGGDQPGLPRTWSAGVGYLAGPFSIEADIEHTWESSDPSYTGSVGYVLLKNFPLRAAGTFLQETEEVQLSLGAGLAFERFGLDVGYRQLLNAKGSGSDADGRLFLVSLRAKIF